MPRRKEKGGKAVTFDVAARHKYLTGFRKRKKERRRKGQRQVLEAERQDKISLKKEHRDEVKKRWKEVQWAERKVEKLLALKESQDGIRRLKRLRQAVDDDGTAITDRIAEAGSENPVTVNFAIEDDDEFGGCEVITTAGTLAATAGDGDEDEESEDDAPAESTLALVGSGRRAALEQKLALLRKYSTETEEQRRQRRLAAMRKAEAIRQNALSKRVTKTMEEKKKMKKKKKVKRKDGHRTKTGARERRRRKTK